jgi:hypothetical protein
VWTQCYHFSVHRQYIRVRCDASRLQVFHALAGWLAICAGTHSFGWIPSQRGHARGYARLGDAMGCRAKFFCLESRVRDD